MRVLGRIAGKPATPIMKLLLAAILCTVLLSLAACSGEQGLPAGDFPPPTETTAVTQRQTEQATPAALQTSLPTATPALRTPSTPAGGATAASMEAPTATPSPAPEPSPTPSPTPRPTLLPTSTPTATPLPTPTPAPTPEPSPTPPPTRLPTSTPTATPSPTPTPAPTATLPPTPTPTAIPAPTATLPPTPTPDPALAGYSPLLVEAVSGYTDRPGFVSGSLTAEEKQILEWADSRVFSNPEFLASKYSPNNWPSQVKNDSVRAFLALMKEIDVEKKSNGKHVINWGVDSLDRILDDLGIYEGVSTSYDPIIKDSRHVHREMLKIFAHFAKADGEGILIRSFMENDADDFEMLYMRDPKPRSFAGITYSESLTVTSFGWRNLTPMSLTISDDVNVKSFPTQVYEIIGGAGSEREAAERWFSHINKNLIHFTGDGDDFADLFRPYSQYTPPYTPGPGYILLVGEAGSPSSTGLTVSAFNLIGLKSEQFFSPEEGRRTGAVEIDGEWFYHDGNWPVSRRILPPCLFLSTLNAVETNTAFDPACIKLLGEEYK